MAQDHVDRMLVVWKRELPDLDLATEGIVERIQKLQMGDVRMYCLYIFVALAVLLIVIFR